RAHHRGDHHHHHRAVPGLRRYRRWLPPVDPDRLRPVDRLCRDQLLHDLLCLQRRGAAAMTAPLDGFSVPLYRSLTEPILLAGAPRNLAILNATAALALGLGLRLWLA